jgi:hypothetical protein
MRSWKISAAVFAAYSIGYLTTASGHGFVMFLSGNKIIAESDDNNSLHNGSLDGNNQELSGFKVLIGSGLNIPNDTFSLELLGPLWFSDGGPGVLAGAGIELKVESYTNSTYTTLMGSAIRSALSSGGTNFSIPGNDDDSMVFSLSGMSIAPGVYGIGMKVHGLDEGNLLTPFDTSEPVVMTFRTEGFSQGNSVTLAEAQTAIYSQAVVPEPSGIALAVAAAGALAMLRRFHT